MASAKPRSVPARLGQAALGAVQRLVQQFESGAHKPHPTAEDQRPHEAVEIAATHSLHQTSSVATLVNDDIPSDAEISPLEASEASANSMVVQPLERSTSMPTPPQAPLGVEDASVENPATLVSSEDDDIPSDAEMSPLEASEASANAMVVQPLESSTSKPTPPQGPLVVEEASVDKPSQAPEHVDNASESSVKASYIPGERMDDQAFEAWLRAADARQAELEASLAAYDKDFG